MTWSFWTFEFPWRRKNQNKKQVELVSDTGKACVMSAATSLPLMGSLKVQWTCVPCETCKLAPGQVAKGKTLKYKANLE